MDRDPLKTMPAGELEKGVQVRNVAVHTPVGEEAQEMEGRPAPFDILDCADESGLFEEIPRPDRTVNSCNLLIDYAAGADVHMADFGVSHQTGGQTDVLA